MDIADQISSLLNSPDGMEKIRSVASSLLGNQDGSVQKPEVPLTNNLSNVLGNAENIGSIMKIVSLLQNQQGDQRVGLLMALKPHLSEERSQKVDKAISILKLVALLPILKNEGLLDKLL